MDDFFIKSILYDVYGNLLDKKKKMVYEYRVLDDLSFSEIGEEMGLTRQACHELFKNADKEIQEYENKLHLAKKLSEIEKLSDSISKSTKDTKIKNLSNKIKKLCEYKEEDF